MQQLNKEFETQMMALKLQLQRTNEIMIRQVGVLEFDLWLAMHALLDRFKVRCYSCL